MNQHMVKRPRRASALLSALLAFTLIAAACGGDDDDATTSEPDPADTAGSEVIPADEGLAVTAVDLATGVVTITNTGAGELDLSGHQLCNRPTYVALPAETLAPGGSIEVTLGGLSADGGEVGLYTSADFGSSDDMISYVTWGSGGGRLSVAEASGSWAGDPIADPGATLTLTGEAGGAAGWADS
jgi:hypothetical protein